MNLCFLLQDQSLLVCHAGQVVIEQKIESEKEEIGRRSLGKREGSEVKKHGRRKSEMARAGDVWGENERMTEKADSAHFFLHSLLSLTQQKAERSCRPNRKHGERWRDGFD